MTNYDAGWGKCFRCGVKRPQRDLVEVKVQVGDAAGVTEVQCVRCPEFKTTPEGFAFLWFGGAAWE